MFKILCNRVSKMDWEESEFKLLFENAILQKSKCIHHYTAPPKLYMSLQDVYNFTKGLKPNEGNKNEQQ